MKKKILTAVAISGALLAVGLSAGQANAALDPGDQFAADAHAQGFYSDRGDDDLVARGGVICVAFDFDTPQIEQQTLYQVWHGSGMTRQQAIQFIKLAVKDLCPEHVSKARKAFG